MFCPGNATRQGFQKKKGEEEGRKETLQTSEFLLLNLSQSDLGHEGPDSDWLIFKTSNFSSSQVSTTQD